MSIQISQQNELLAGLSQQLRDKDASITQVIESASNERMKLSEEKTSLMAQLESVEQEHQTSMKRLEEVSQQLEEHVSRSQSEMESKHAEKLEVIKEKDATKSELAKVSKERDALKKKLQAALITLSEKGSFIEQLQSSAAEKEEACERDRNGWQQKLDELQNEIRTCKDELKDKSSSTATAVDLENELAQMKLEKAMLQKKAQAALLARKETMKKAQENEKKLNQELAEAERRLQSSPGTALPADRMSSTPSS
ncbi:hypothetical protein GBF38_006614 [Nibea albiflora]|uniref:Uncharacterized protein n=1 Tax=Nibea albiflora TaxID=240163 RepID=A0ACB7EJQ9_NIBAL|nr:hypothetical protein GBF38_006614 [Nibea albiflora]